MKILIPTIAAATEAAGAVKIGTEMLTDARDTAKGALKELSIEKTGLVAAEWMPTNIIGAGAPYRRAYSRDDSFSPAPVLPLLAALRAQVGLPAVEPSILAARCAENVTKLDDIRALAKRAGVEPAQLTAALAAQQKMGLKQGVRMTVNPKAFVIDPALQESASKTIDAAMKCEVVARRKVKTEDIEEAPEF